MEEGNWIEMTGIPLIVVEGTAAEGGAADDAEGGGAETGRDANHEAEGLMGQGAEAAHDDRIECAVPAEGNPADDAEHAVGAEHVVLAVRTPPKPLLRTLKTSSTHRLRRRTKLQADQLWVAPMTWCTRPSLKLRCTSSALRHPKLTPKMQATQRLIPSRPPLPKLRSEGLRTRVQLN
jgi:hypothetical protein